MLFCLEHYEFSVVLIVVPVITSIFSDYKLWVTFPSINMRQVITKAAH